MARIFLISLTAAGLAFGQAAGVPPQIEVASIKASDPALASIGNHFSPGLYNYRGYPLKTLIEDAFGVRDYQVLNAAGWLRSERWDIDLKTTAPADGGQRAKILQTLLAERFHLKYRREIRTMPIYCLVVAKGGLKLKLAEEAAQQGARYGNMIVDKKYDIRRLAGDLTANLNMPVVDKTGLTGVYDMDLKWTPDPARGEFGDVHDPAEMQAPDPNRPEIFTAIKEQLGLELKAEKGPVPVIVIEHAERPTPN